MPRRKVGLIPPNDETTHRPPLLVPRFLHRSPLILHRSKANRTIGLIRNRTDLAANHAKRKDRPKKKARGLATLRPAAALVCADGGDLAAAPADVWRSEKAPDGGALAQNPALHTHGRYAEEVAKLDEVRQEGPRELNRWDVALEIFTTEEAYPLRRFVDKVPQPVNERRETLGLSVHDDDNGGGDVLDRTAFPAGSNGVTLLGHGGVACVGNYSVMGVNSDVPVPGNGRDRVMQQDNGFLQPCSTTTTHPDASGMDGYQQHTEAMDMYGYDYDRIATINQQLACDDLMNAGTSLQTNNPDSQHYLCYREDMHLQDCNSGENNLPSIQSPAPLPPAAAPSTEQFSRTEGHYGKD
jgi:hypothetical protein